VILLTGLPLKEVIEYLARFLLRIQLKEVLFSEHPAQGIIVFLFGICRTLQVKTNNLFQHFEVSINSLCCVYQENRDLECKSHRLRDVAECYRRTRYNSQADRPIQKEIGKSLYSIKDV